MAIRMFIEKCHTLSRDLFRKLFRAEPTARMQVRSIDVSDQLVESALGMRLNDVYGCIRDLLQEAGHGGDPWNASKSAGGCGSLIAENFLLGWVCCRICWEYDGPLEEEFGKVIQPPYQNKAAQVVRGLEEYWQGLAEYTERTEDCRPLVLPEVGKAGNERHVLSTKRLVVPRKRDLALIRSATAKKWPALSEAGRIALARDIGGIDERLRIELSTIYSLLAKGLTKRQREIWKRISDYVETRISAAKLPVESVVTFLWDPSKYEPANVYVVALASEQLVVRLETEGPAAVINDSTSWSANGDSPKLLPFVQGDHPGVWLPWSHSDLPITRLLAHRSLRAQVIRFSHNGKPPSEIMEDWDLWTTDPCMLPLTELEEGLRDCSGLLRRIPEPRMSIRGGVRIDGGGYLLANGLLPRVSGAGFSRVLLKQNGTTLPLKMSEGEWAIELDRCSPGNCLLEGMDDDGAIVAQKSLSFVHEDAPGRSAIRPPYPNPPPSLQLYAPSSLLDGPSDGYPTLPGGSNPHFVPEVAPADDICDLTAWHSAEVFLGPRIGEISEQARPGFGWSVRFSAGEQPLLTWIGNAQSPNPLEANTNKSCCRLWRQAFSRSLEDEDLPSAARESHGAYRAALSRKIDATTKKVELGERPAVTFVRAPNEPRRVTQDGKIRTALTILSSICSRANGHRLCHWSLDEERDHVDPGRILEWLPEVLGVHTHNGRVSPEIWRILRLWQESGIIDILPAVTNSGLRWIGRPPEWQCVRTGDWIQATLVGLVDPVWMNQLREQARMADLDVCLVASESAWAPEILRCRFLFSDLGRFREWSRQHGLEINSLLSAPGGLPAWIKPVTSKSQFLPQYDDSEPSVGGWSYDDREGGFTRSMVSSDSGLWLVHRPGFTSKWVLRTQGALRWTPIREEAVLLAAFESGLPTAIKAEGADIIIKVPGRYVLPIYLPIPIARYCVITADTLPGPSNGIWRYRFSNEFVAQSVAKRLGIIQQGGEIC